MSKFTYAIIIASDKGFSGERQDLCVETIKGLVDSDFELVSHKVLPDEQDLLREEMIRLSDELNVNLLLTSGGTGF